MNNNEREKSGWKEIERERREEETRSWNVNVDGSNDTNENG